MRSIIFMAGTAGLITTLLTACGGEDRAKVAPVGTGGKGNFPDPIRNGGADDGGASDALGPQVKITSPVQLDDPDDGEVVSGSVVTVSCEVRASTQSGAGNLDESSIRLAVLSDGEVVAEKAGSATENPNVFSNEFTLTDVASGVIGFRCSAADDAQHSAITEIETFLDKGPVVTFVSPVADEAHALNEALDIEFTVAPDPLEVGDEGADVATVALDIAGRKIDLSEAETKPGRYHLQVNLADRKLFDPAPSGLIPLTVTATNSRSPSPVTAKVLQNSLIDGEGPTVKITSPSQLAIVGGLVRLTINATDPLSRVDPQTLLVTLNAEENYFDENDDRWSDNGAGVYTFEFDSRQRTETKLQITVNVAAKDMVGNESLPSSVLLYVDNFPPFIDLDPFNIRSTSDQTSPYDCSASFDPVGTDAVNDLDTVPVLGLFRALIYDDTNKVAGVGERHWSMPDPTKAKLYLDTRGGALLVDKTKGDSDPSCNDVANPDSGNSVDLAQVPATGAAPLSTDGEESTAPTSAELSCSPVKGTQPVFLCNQKAGLRQVVMHGQPAATALYGVAPTAGDFCAGINWEFTTKLRPGDLEAGGGWACLVARSVDHAGNVGVSRPVRVCVNDPDKPAPPCATMSVEPPSCTDGCTPPARLGNILWHAP